VDSGQNRLTASGLVLTELPGVVELMAYQAHKRHAPGVVAAGGQLSSSRTHVLASLVESKLH
jgi:spore germination protein YaaH